MISKVEGGGDETEREKGGGHRIPHPNMGLPATGDLILTFLGELGVAGTAAMSTSCS